MKINKLFLILLVSILMLPISLKAESSYPYQGMITADALVVKDDSGKEVTQLAYGTRVTVNGKKGNSYLINFASGSGYANEGYVLDISNATLTTDVEGRASYQEYCNLLKSKGFTDLYCPYLYKIYVNHPNWIFNANVIGKSIEEVSEAETSRCVLQTSNSNYYLNGNFIEGSYYYVKPSVITSFLDPRNSMYEQTIFQFLDNALTKDMVNIDVLKNLVSSGVLANNVDSFVQAGINNNINALHIYSRSKQEGANGTFKYNNNTYVYSAVGGEYTNIFGKGYGNYSLNGYFNFFNIGAWQDGDLSTVQRGLAYAAGYITNGNASCYNESGLYIESDACPALSYQRPWNTPARAISGGAEFIASTYVNVGQNTKYYEKFNVNPNNKENIYSHQYMTNLYAPAGEGIMMGNAYKKSTLYESNFVFNVPVYNNMKDTPYQAIDYSNIPELDAIKVNNKLINNYDKDIKEYTYYASTNDEKINVSAVTSHNAKIIGLGDYTFNGDSVTVTINSTSEDGSNSVTYTLTIKKIAPENYVDVNEVVNKLAVKVNNDVMFGISPNTSVITLVNSINSMGASVSVYDENNNLIDVNSSILKTGNRIVINGTSESKSYNIAVRGDISGDGIADIRDLILLQSDILEKEKLGGVRRIAANTNYDDKINIQDLVLIQSHILEKEGL